MHGTLPAATADKRRTITLTNRAPIRIHEDEWPIIAKGTTGEDWYGGEYGWQIELFVRREKTPRPYSTGERYIVHAKYIFEDDNDNRRQTVRVGRVLDWNDAQCDLWKTILAVGEELRERINNENLRRCVTHAVDGCFATLAPRDA